MGKLSVSKMKRQRLSLSSNKASPSEQQRLIKTEKVDTIQSSPVISNHYASKSNVKKRNVDSISPSLESQNDIPTEITMKSLKKEEQLTPDHCPSSSTTSNKPSAISNNYAKNNTPKSNLRTKSPSTSKRESDLENITLKLSHKESIRDEKRKQFEELFEQMQKIREKMNGTQEELQVLDDDIEKLEEEQRCLVNQHDDNEYHERRYAPHLTQKDSPSLSVKREKSPIPVTDEDAGYHHHRPSDSTYFQNNMTTPPSNNHMTTAATATAAASIPPNNQLRNIPQDYEDAPNPEEFLEDEPFPDHEYDVSPGTMEDMGEDPRDHISEPSPVRKRAPVTATYGNGSASYTSSSDLQTAKVHHASTAAALLLSTCDDEFVSNTATTASASTTNNATKSNGTLPLHHYFAKSSPAAPLQSSSSTTTASNSKSIPPAKMPSASSSQQDQIPTLSWSNIPESSSSTAAAAASSSIFPPSLQQRYDSNPRSNRVSASTTDNDRLPTNLSSNDFPWSQPCTQALRHTFKIQTFRDHQKEIINCTMSNIDTFVIMRTGGGKSLTYQLPALLEGRGQAKKITLVVSPLLSLIHDQVNQMNAFVPGSAISFTSGMKGGATEYARRWNLVRDPDSGICIIFVTPERVSKSNKLKSELEKLNNVDRLGRFVIDECHCACQWGHDFRPDYTKLGILKRHFPKVPLIAVTATASERVKEDCCNILNIDRNYKFFRSTSNRPNLKYCVKVKDDKQENVITDIANFIHEHHSKHAGIVYTFSRKEAEDVAGKLNNDHGISARAYHSSVSESSKEAIHKSWMRNKMQVIVATIAFGLGINKPDVRFVLHYSVSKSLEAYYQESGRAGRDGNPADCILYYSVKDVSRMIGMIHGDNGEMAFWSMVRYGQEFGNDSYCRRMILSTLGEPGYDVEDVVRNASVNPNTETRQVGMHGKIVAQIIAESPKNLTLVQIVTIWRRGKNAPDYVKEHPPSPDLTKLESEILIISLLLSGVFFPNIVYTQYSSIVYIALNETEQTAKLLSHPDPIINVNFLKRDLVPNSKQVKKNGSITSNNDAGWISTKKQPKPKKIPKNSKDKRKGRKSGDTSQNTTGRSIEEVISILDDSDSDDSDSQFLASSLRKRPSRRSSQTAARKMKATIDIFDDSESD